MSQLLNDQVVVKFDPRQATYELAPGVDLLIPEAHQKQPGRATVIAVGPGRVLRKAGGQREEPQVKPGDIIITTKLGWKPRDLGDGQGEVWFGNYDQILAIDVPEAA